MKLENLTIKKIDKLLISMENVEYRQNLEIKQLKMRVEELEARLKDANRIKELYRQQIMAKLNGTYDAIVEMQKVNIIV